MKKTKLTAKEEAWLRDKQKLKHEIRVLEMNLKDRNEEIHTLKEQISELEETNRQYKDWIERLCEYTEMPEDDMKATVERQKELNDLFMGFKDVINFFNLPKFFE